MKKENVRGKVTGVGGIFFTAEHPAEVKAWYHRHLGITGLFYGNDAADPTKRIYTAWDVLPKDHPLFQKTGKEFCYRYRVDALEPLLQKLKASEIQTFGPTLRDEFGQHATIFDPENNLVSLWEPSQAIPSIPEAALPPVRGLGGLFFKSVNPPVLKAWYQEQLGFDVTEWGCTFFWIDPANPNAAVPARTEWSTFKEETDYFRPSPKRFMLNYRVNDLRALFAKLETEGVSAAGEVQEFSYGKFGWILDPEQNKMELWEPIDDGL